MRSVERAECLKCGVLKIQSVESAECLECGVLKVWSVENAECENVECWKCGVF